MEHDRNSLEDKADLLISSQLYNNQQKAMIASEMLGILNFIDELLPYATVNESKRMLTIKIEETEILLSENIRMLYKEASEKNYKKAGE